MSENLTKAEQSEINKVTASLMHQDAQHSKNHGHTFVPNIVKGVVPPDIWKSLSKKDKANCIQIFLRAEIICSCPQRGRNAKDAMSRMFSGASSAPSALGALRWNQSMVDGNLQEAQNRNFLLSKAYDRPGDKVDMTQLSKLVFCFQQYAYSSIAEPPLPQEPLRYPELTVREPVRRNFAGVNGVLDAGTRSMLQYLYPNFVKVGPSAAPLNLIGKLLAAIIMMSASWYGLDRAFMEHDHTIKLTAVQKAVSLQGASPIAPLFNKYLLTCFGSSLHESNGDKVFNPLAYINSTPYPELTRALRDATR